MRNTYLTRDKGFSSVISVGLFMWDKNIKLLEFPKCGPVKVEYPVS